MRCLLIVASSLPQVPSEAQEVSNLLTQSGHSTHLLQSSLTSLELFRSLDHGPFDLVWIASHSGEKGFEIGNQTLSPEELGRFLLEARCRDLILNSCFSALHVDAIQRYASVNIVATVRPDLDDVVAWSSALYLTRALIRTNDLWLAYSETMSSGSSIYRWFPRIVRLDDQMNDNSRIDRLERSVEQMINALKGDPFTKSLGLIEAMTSLQLEIGAYIKADASWKRDTESRIEELEMITRHPVTLVRQNPVVVVVGVILVLTISFVLMYLSSGSY